MSSGRRDREAFRFDARYGRLIRKAGIGTIPFALFYYQAELDLSPQEVWLIGYVLSHRWTSELPFPAVREIARRSGVTTKTIEKYKKLLEEKGYLDVVRRRRADGGNTSIGWDFSALFERIDRLITRDIDDWIRRNPQFLEEEIPGLEGDDVDNSVDKSSPVRRVSHGAVGDGSHGAARDGSDGAGGDGSHGPRSTGRTLIEEDPEDEEFASADSRRAVKTRERKIRATTRSNSNRDGSTGPPLDLSDQAEKAPPAPVSPLIDRIVEDYSTRLHDAPRSVRSNGTRARRIWAASGLSEDDFIALLHEAYRRTQENSHRIRKSATEGLYGTKNKMPYYFSVLRSLVDPEET